VQGGGNRSPFQAMQELLNASEPLQWGIVSNGKQLRCCATLPRSPVPAFSDLADLLGGQRYAESPMSGASAARQPRIRPAEALRRASGNNGAAKATEAPACAMACAMASSRPADPRPRLPATPRQPRLRAA
jgi:hypothetical protein